MNSLAANKSEESMATHKTIAERAGVSRSRVTQILHGTRSSRVSEETRLAVLRVAKELNYQPRNRTTHNIGYVLDMASLDIENEIQSIKEIQSALPQRGYRLILAEVDQQHPEELSKILNAKTVDGVIFSHWPNDIDLSEFVPSDVPYVVSADADSVGPELDQVRLDTFEATRLITSHLIGHGHQRICFVTGMDGISLERRVRGGFYAAFEENGIPRSQGSLIEVIDARNIAHLLGEELRKPNPATALLGLEFMRVAAILNYLQSRGYRVPEDISLASIFDSDQYEWLRPSMTATSSSGKHIAQYAIKRLLKKMEDSNAPQEQIIIPTHLIPRASVTAPKDVMASKSI